MNETYTAQIREDTKREILEYLATHPYGGGKAIVSHIKRGNDQARRAFDALVSEGKIIREKIDGYPRFRLVNGAPPVAASVHGNGHTNGHAVMASGTASKTRLELCEELVELERLFVEMEQKRAEILRQLSEVVE